MTRHIALVLASACLAASTAAQSPIDLGTISRIKQEALTRSRAMDHVAWMSDVYGPRVTGTPNFQRASEWAMKQLTEWGLANVHQERFAFGQGWRVERFSAHMIAPEPQPIIGYPRTFSPSTKGTISGDVVARGHPERRGFREIQRHAQRQDRSAAGRASCPHARGPDHPSDERRGHCGGADDAHSRCDGCGGCRPGATGAAGAKGPTLNERIAQFFVTEGVAAVLERGSDSDMSAGGSDLSWQTQRVDGGTIFPGGGGSRDPKTPAQVPSATIAVEHYNRMVRILEKNIPVRVELNIQATFYPEAAGTPNGINILAEIPGSDLADEVVIMGAHFDTTPGATGATDNATGSAAMMEALRIIKSLGLRPRRTIRVALWGGEEQGLLGSRAYVAEHYGTEASPKPAHATVAAYYNLDNGTGKIRGIWGQGNLGAMALFREWIESVEDLGVELIGPRSVGATDHAAFDSAGIPGFQFIQERLEYNSRTHHSNMDFVDRVQREDLVQQAAVAAVFAWYTANWPEKLPRKVIPGRPGTQ